MESFSLNGFVAPDGSPNIWSIADSKRATASTDQTGHSVIHSLVEEFSYVVHNASSREFRAIRAGGGLPLLATRAFELYSDFELPDAVSVRLMLLEYNASGDRIGEVNAAANKRVKIVFRPETETIVVTIRLAGVGHVTLRKLSLAPINDSTRSEPGAYPLPARSGTDRAPEEHARALREELTALESASRHIGREVDSLLESVTRGATSTRTETLLARSTAREFLLSMASSLPVSNGSHYFRDRFQQRAVIISDVYMLNFYRDSFTDLTYAHPDNIEEIISNGFDLLIYVTCWRGVNQDEWRGTKFREKPRAALERLLAFAKDRSIPTVFQSIEDPSNFDYFLPIARQFDYVFTSDIECVPRYVEVLGHSRVHYGEYGANPLLNNPIGSRRFTINRAFFAGSYPKRYPRRIDDMHTIFDSILATGQRLLIADRNDGNSEYAFPQKYSAHSIESLPHELLQTVHKLFRISLNFNSITSSPTMCAMRVYELQAQGRTIVSNYARSVLNRFPEIRLITGDESLASLFDQPETPEELLNNEQLIRNVLTASTSFDVIGAMLDAMGLDTAGVGIVPEVLVVTDTQAPDLPHSIGAQSYPSIRTIDSDSFSQAPELSLGGAKYVARMDTSDVAYGRDYIRDRVNAFKYTDVEAVTQIGTLSPAGLPVGAVHDYVEGLVDPALTLFAADRCELRDIAAGKPVRASGYALAPFEASARNQQTVRGAQPKREPDLSIIVPIFNNGHFLATKCIPSIQRCRDWRSWQILLMDDGSQDPDTRRICNELVSRYPNFEFHSFNDAGSGSASRPRNAGIELAQAPVLTFLDPDNEISEGGYDRLLALHARLMEAAPVPGFVSGFQRKVTGEQISINGRHAGEALRIVDDPRSTFFSNGRFPVVSTQAAVMSTSLFDDKRLRFVEGGAGQDTLFGWELLLTAQSCAFTDEAHLVYYAERTGSVTNATSSDYFNKCLVLERAQVKKLREHGVFDAFVERHLGPFVRGWYLKKLKQMAPSERAAAEADLRTITELYGADYDFLISAQ